MMFIALFWAQCLAAEDVQSLSAPISAFVQPWEIPQRQVDNCTTFCSDWTTLYSASDDGCVGDDESAVSEDILFCPDKAAIMAWTVDQELEFEAIYSRSEKLDVSEIEMFQLLVLERENKLSVLPMQMLHGSPEVPQERRRVKGSQYSYSCFGGNGGQWVWYEKGKRPTRLAVRSGSLIDRLEITYSDGSVLRGGGYGGGLRYHNMPSCTNIVLIKSGALIDSIQFLTQGYETDRYGGNGGGTYVLVAPAGRCLGDIKFKVGSLVDKICLKFNGN